jgi:uncharacterized OsmC-like protein
VRVTYEEALDIQFSTVNVRGETLRNVNGGFVTITQEMHATGNMTPEALEHLADRAQAICFTHNTLKYGVKLVTAIHLNGEEAFRRVNEPLMPRA